ncbi:hypothetical protein ACHAWF_017513 [Thalassiosira exigua]
MQQQAQVLRALPQEAIWQQILKNLQQQQEWDDQGQATIAHPGQGMIDQGGQDVEYQRMLAAMFPEHRNQARQHQQQQRGPHASHIDPFQTPFDAFEARGVPYPGSVQGYNFMPSGLATLSTNISSDCGNGGKNKGNDCPWDPFHPDVQRTVHFWGYHGSLTEPPCSDKALWRIMDVPVLISTGQLDQMRRILFANRDPGTCRPTSNHWRGSVARPVREPLPYYKCTRSDYVSDEERGVCGDEGCEDAWYGPGLDPYIEPIVHVTGPPSERPTALPSEQPTEFDEGV